MAAVVGFLPIISAAFTVISAISQGQQAQAQSRYNAQIAERNAAIAREQAARDAEAQQRDASRKIGAARASYGASGVTMEGSPLDVLSASAMAAELDRQNILYKGNLSGMGYQETASLDRARGDAAVTSSYSQAGSAILLGASRQYEVNQKAKLTQT